MTTNLVVFGATGAVGQEVLKACARFQPSLNKVYVFVRNESALQRLMSGVLSEEGVKERIAITKFDGVKDVGEKIRQAGIAVDNQCALISCLGTTQKTAGSSENFKAIDYGLNMEIAKHCFELGVRRYFLVSSTGADSKSRFFYPRVKGELEDAVCGIGFSEVWLYRPTLLLTTPRGESRPFETMLQGFSKMVDLAGFWSIRASDVALAILVNATKGLATAPKQTGGNRDGTAADTTATSSHRVVLHSGDIRKVAESASKK